MYKVNPQINRRDQNKQMTFQQLQSQAGVAIGHSSEERWWNGIQLNSEDRLCFKIKNATPVKDGKIFLCHFSKIISE